MDSAFRPPKPLCSLDRCDHGFIIKAGVFSIGKYHDFHRHGYVRNSFFLVQPGGVDDSRYNGGGCGGYNGGGRGGYDSRGNRHDDRDRHGHHRDRGGHYGRRHSRSRSPSPSHKPKATPPSELQLKKEKYMLARELREAIEPAARREIIRELAGVEFELNRRR